MLVCHSSFIFFNDTATTEIYTLSLHDALPICNGRPVMGDLRYLADTKLLTFTTALSRAQIAAALALLGDRGRSQRSEEHTSELQSRQYLVCRLLLEKKRNCLHQ